MGLIIKSIPPFSDNMGKVLWKDVNVDVVDLLMMMRKGGWNCCQKDQGGGVEWEFCQFCYPGVLGNVELN